LGPIGKEAVFHKSGKPLSGDANMNLVFSPFVFASFFLLKSSIREKTHVENI